MVVLHIAIHMPPNQRLNRPGCARPPVGFGPGRQHRYKLAQFKAVPAVVQNPSDLLSRPGVFVFGSNDYFGPRLKKPR